MNDVTKILKAVQDGDARAAEELLPLVYSELRQMAASKMADEKPGHTLQPTALVHEAYLRLIGGSEPQLWNARGHFFMAAAEAMRRILIENARRRNSQKRGGGLQRENLDEQAAATSQISDDVWALDEALTKLAGVDSKAAELVKLRHFAGLTIPQTAEVLGVSPRSANDLWTYARAWLYGELTKGDR